MRRWRGQILAEIYPPLGSRDVDTIVAEIRRLEPDAVLNTLNGDSNVAFFERLRAAGTTPQKTPTISFSIAEEELRSLPVHLMVSDYAAWSYFQSIQNAGNIRFVRDFKRRYGEERVTSDPIEMAYVAPHIWAAAVASAGSVEPPLVRAAAVGRSFRAAEGMIHIDRVNHHSWKPVHIGRVRGDGQFDIVWSSERPIRPEPFPALRSRQEWTQFLAELNKRWGGRWVSPASGVSLFYSNPHAEPQFAQRPETRRSKDAAR